MVDQLKNSTVGTQPIEGLQFLYKENQYTITFKETKIGDGKDIQLPDV